MDNMFGTTLPENLVIPTNHLEDLIKYKSSQLVGKVLKRIEITSDKDTMKSQIRELIYEEYRSFEELIIALNFGLQISSFVFKTKEKSEETK